MTDASPVLRVRETAPETVLRLGLIVAGLAALIARRFLRDPKFGALVGPLWSWLNRSVQRFGRARSVAVPMLPLAARARAPMVGVDRAARVRFPAGRGWLVKALGWEAAGYGSQLQTLLAEPEMMALLDAIPAVGRVLRPLGRMLGVQVGPVVVKVAAAPKPRAVRVRAPRPKREKPWSPGRIPVSWWGGAKSD